MRGAGAITIGCCVITCAIGASSAASLPLLEQPGQVAVGEQPGEPAVGVDEHDRPGAPAACAAPARTRSRTVSVAGAMRSSSPVRMHSATTAQLAAQAAGRVEAGEVLGA